MRKIKSFIFLALLASISVTIYIVASANIGGTEDTTKENIIESVISPDEDFQKAIQSIKDGGKLILNEGVYNTLEPIVLEGRKDLIIEGNGEVWINTKGIDHHVITLSNCQNITLSNIKAQHVIVEEGDNDTIADARDGAVVGILDGGNINLIDCELVGCGIYGVYAYSATPLSLEGCYLHDNSESAILFITDANPMHTLIRDCKITKNADSVEIRGDVVLKKEGRNEIHHNSPLDYQNSEYSFEE